MRRARLDPASTTAIRRRTAPDKSPRPGRPGRRRSPACRAWHEDEDVLRQGRHAALRHRGSRASHVPRGGTFPAAALPTSAQSEGHARPEGSRERRRVPAQPGHVHRRAALPPALHRPGRGAVAGAARRRPAGDASPRPSRPDDHQLPAAVRVGADLGGRAHPLRASRAGVAGHGHRLARRREHRFGGDRPGGAEHPRQPGCRRRDHAVPAVSPRRHAAGRDAHRHRGRRGQRDLARLHGGQDERRAARSFCPTTSRRAR